MKPRKSKRHFKKDTNAPKMPTRPYILFANEMRPQLRAEGKTMSFGFAREIGKLWAQLSKNDKQEYYRDFDSKFAIYKKKADRYKTTMNYKNYIREKAAFTAKYAPSSTKPAPDPNAPTDAPTDAPMTDAPQPTNPRCVTDTNWQDGDTSSPQGPYGCNTYVQQQWCRAGTYGPNWDTAWGKSSPQLF